MKVEIPRWSLILYRDDRIGCVYIEDARVAVREGRAIPIATEDADLCLPPIDAPTHIAQSGGRRRVDFDHVDGVSDPLDNGD